jgi:hypothetical protein
MQVEKSGETTRIVLMTSEVPLLRWALERASFIDTPAVAQAAIATFCAKLLEALGGTPPRP